MAALEATKAAKGYAASYLMVTDILAEDTYLWFTSGAEEAAEKAFGKKQKTALYICRRSYPVRNRSLRSF